MLQTWRSLSKVSSIDLPFQSPRRPSINCTYPLFTHYQALFFLRDTRTSQQDKPLLFFFYSLKSIPSRQCFCEGGEGGPGVFLLLFFVLYSYCCFIYLLFCLFLELLCGGGGWLIKRWRKGVFEKVWLGLSLGLGAWPGCLGHLRAPFRVLEGVGI